MPQKVVCPICQTEVDAGPRHGMFDGEAFDCPTHGQFEISKTLMEEIATLPDFDRARLARGLEKARHNISPSHVPLITTLEV